MAFVEFEQRGHVGLITINRPEVLNALNLEVIEQLDDILLRAESQEDVHVIVITGAGRSFVAGADIGSMSTMTKAEGEAFGKLGDFEDAARHQYYNEGVDAENRKDYEKALYDYSAAGNVTDASDRLLNLQGQIYNRAIELREEHSYEEAIYLFTILGDYLSSARQAVECEQIFRDDQYSQADAMEMAGDLQGAYDLFSTLTGFRDAAQRASDLASRLGIPDTSESD